LNVVDTSDHHVPPGLRYRHRVVLYSCILRFSASGEIR
jgi:hypothetical protein